MNRRVLSFLVVLLSLSAIAQQSPTANVPHVVRFAGTIANTDGTPRSGVVGVMFSLYSEQQGRTALWTELQNVTLDANGQYTVLLGSQHSDGVPADLFTTNEARWLGIQVEAEPEQARVLLVSVPYALKAGDAETLGGKPLSAFLLNPNSDASNTGSSTTTTGIAKTPRSTTSMEIAAVNTTTNGGTANYVAKWLDASTLGNSVLYDDGINVGIGTTTPAQKLEVDGNLFMNASNPKIVFLDTAGAVDSRRWQFFAGGNAFHFMSVNDADNDAREFMRVDRSGINVTAVGFGEAALSAGSTRLSTAGPRTVYFDNSGPVDNRKWQMVATGGGFHLMTLNDAENDAREFMLVNRSGVNVTGVNFGGQLSANNIIQSTNGGFKFPDNSTQVSAGITGANSSAGINSSVANGLLTLSGDATYLQKRISGTCAAGSAVSIVNSDGTVGCQTVGSGGGSVVPPLILSANVVGGGTDSTKLSTIYGANTAVGVQNPDPSSNFPPAGVVGHASNAAATGFTIGVLGRSDAPVGAGVLAMATGDGTQTDRATALTAFTTSTTGRTKGIEATVNSSNGTVMSLRGPSGATLLDASIGTLGGGSNGSSMFHLDTTSASFSVNNFNISGQNGNANAQINGNLTVFSIGAPGNCNTPPCNLTVNGGLFVSGNLSKSSGSFKIDHPLDPSNKYLYHSFVESPDMMNIYNGVIVLDARGQAWIQMPDWFEALNQDFRYQLTSIGAPGPNLFIAKEISGNRFRIAGGKPHAKVSWQVTGIRHDAYADAHRIQVEVDKGTERGTYIHPELFGQSGGSINNADAATKTPAAPVPADNN